VDHGWRTDTATAELTNSYSLVTIDDNGESTIESLRKRLDNHESLGPYGNIEKTIYHLPRPIHWNSSSSGRHRSRARTRHGGSRRPQGHTFSDVVHEAIRGNPEGLDSHSCQVTLRTAAVWRRTHLSNETIVVVVVLAVPVLGPGFTRPGAESQLCH
jgi:hypothetical protein